MAKDTSGGAGTEAEGGSDFVGGGLIRARTRVGEGVGGEGAAFVGDGGVNHGEVRDHAAGVADGVVGEDEAFVGRGVEGDAGLSGVVLVAAHEVDDGGVGDGLHAGEFGGGVGGEVAAEVAGDEGEVGVVVVLIGSAHGCAGLTEHGVCDWVFPESVVVVVDRLGAGGLAPHHDSRGVTTKIVLWLLARGKVRKVRTEQCCLVPIPEPSVDPSIPGSGRRHQRR